MKIKIGLIRVLTIRGDELLNSHGRLIETHFSNLKVISKCIRDQSEGIHNEETEQIAIPKIVELGMKMAKEEFRAIIVSCTDDPGVAELRSVLDVPVIGAGSSAASLSLSYGSRVGILGITEKTPKIMKEILGQRIVAELKPECVKTSLDLMTEEGKSDAFRVGDDLRKRGAEVITLSCTGYSTIGLAECLQKAVGIPVIDPILSAGLFTWYLVGRNKWKSRV